MALGQALDPDCDRKTFPTVFPVVPNEANRPTLPGHLGCAVGTVVRDHQHPHQFGRVVQRSDRLEGRRKGRFLIVSWDENDDTVDRAV